MSRRGAMRPLCRSAWLLAVGALLAGCFPTEPANTPPVAIRATSSSEVEVLLVPCSPVRITRFEVTAPQEAFQDPDDPRVWQVDFSPPATGLRQVALGKVPPGGTEQVPWPAGGLEKDADKSYVVQVLLDDGVDWNQSFEVSDLTDGRIMFHDRYVSPETFADQSRCP